jgi:hypothetical protein
VVSCHPGWTLTDGVEAAYGEKKSYLEVVMSHAHNRVCFISTSMYMNKSFMKKRKIPFLSSFFLSIV